MSLFTVPESQFFQIEHLSQFDLAAFIDQEGLFESQDSLISLENDALTEQIKSQFFVQNEEYTELEVYEKTLDDISESSLSFSVSFMSQESQIPELKDHMIEMNNKELVD
ncbi:hypothetical protein ACJ72_08339 [Emergomyces africanus]|uniref:Uncharacterized protein n=1 Tax=Emergomyces africanus TaxID=1955775 RepID=A0A1B7NKQ5_9EURO|nr:hypothetical protein ACJ72_08339 [Emergomyces africanus]